MFPLGNAKKNQLVNRHTENKYYDTGYVVDINNKGDAKSFIAGYIGKDKVCLDVGCGAGLLGEALKKYKNADVYGIELDKKALDYARKTNSYKGLYNFSVTELEGKEYDKFVKAGIKFDYIIFADLLEHVISPENVLIPFSKFLKPNGKILVSLPNVAHLDIVKGLINRNFNYNQVGLLDNTHLRFYTKKSFRQFIEQINDVFDQNFAVKEIGKIAADPEYTALYPNIYGILNKDGEVNVLQYLYEISIDKKNKKIKEEKEEKYFEEIEKLLKQRNELEARVGVLEQELTEVYASTSWKITKPLREGAAVLKKNKKK